MDTSQLDLVRDDHHLIKQTFAQVLSNHLELVIAPLERLVEAVVQIPLALLILTDQVPEVAVDVGTRGTRVIVTVNLKAVGVKGVLAQAVDRGEVELPIAVLAVVGLENDGLRLQLVYFFFELHSTSQVAIHLLLVLFYFLFFSSHSFQQVFLYEIEKRIKIYILK